MSTLVTSALVMGLLGGVHCAAMCGGIVGALNARPRDAVRVHGSGAATLAGPPLGQLPLHLAYSAGRVGSYAVAGAAAGTLGGTAILLDSMLPVQVALAVVAHGLVVLLGLYLAGVGRGVARLERLGAGLWRRVAPLGQRFLPADTVPRALAVGAVWGWLPCGLVYSALALALLSGSPAAGAATMLAFGAGTVPNLIGTGIAVRSASGWLRRPGVRLGAGLAVAALGLWGIARTPGLAEHIRSGLLCLT
jgi:sulfite exporter TauE/SafE